MLLDRCFGEAEDCGSAGIEADEPLETLFCSADALDFHGMMNKRS